MSDKVEYFMIKNWEKHQHYKHRNPTWIKLHTSILDNYKFHCMTPMARLTYLLLLPLVARCSNKIPRSSRWAAGKLGLTRDKAKIDELIENGFLVPYVASVTCPQRQSRVEKRQSRVETEKKPLTPLVSDPNFDTFWSAYPKRKKKADARKAWSKLNPTPALQDAILVSIRNQKRSKQWTKEDGDFIPLPASWLRGECWLDEIEVEIIDDGLPRGNPHNDAVLRKILREEGEIQ